MPAAQPRPLAPTLFAAVWWMLFISLATGIAFAVFAVALVSVIRWIPAFTFLGYWSGFFLVAWARWRQQRLLWMFALAMGLLYTLIIVGFLWYLPLALSLLGPFLALLVTVSFAQGMRPSPRSSWLLLMGCGLLGGAATALGLWLLLGPGVITLPMMLVLALAAGLVGPVGGVLHWAFDMLWPRLRRGRTLNTPEQPPTTATTGLSRREVLLGLGGLAGLAVTGASFTWLTRSLLAHVFPLVTYKSVGQVQRLSWSPDGKRLISSLGEKFGGGWITIWDVTTGKEIVSPQNAEARGYGGIQAVAWSPGGRHSDVVICQGGQDPGFQRANSSGPPTHARVGSEHGGEIAHFVLDSSWP